MTWIPIASAPKDGTEIMLIQFWRNENGVLDHNRPDHGCWSRWNEDRGYGSYEVCEGWMTDYGSNEDWTHWMPLPDPPKEAT